MKLNKFLSLILLLFPLTSVASFRDATTLYEKGLYEEAFNEYYQLAKIGHKDSQFNVGVMYFEGVGVDKDPLKAYAWVKLSDEDKLAEKVFLEEIRQEITKEQPLIDEFYESLKSKYGNDAIAEAYQPVIVDDKKETVSPKAIKQKPAKYPINARVKGYTGWVLFDFNLSPGGYPTDIKVVDSFPKDLFVKSAFKAVKNWRFEPLNTSERFTYKMEFMLLDGNSDYKAKYKSLMEIKEKALKGDPSSQYLHARYGDYNIEDNKNFSSSSWYYEAARNGVLNAQFELAERLLDGDGCEKDPDKAINWLKASANSGFALSQFELAKMSFTNGDAEKGELLLKKAITNSLEVSSLDAETTRYDIVDYIYNNQLNNIKPELILQLLEHIGRYTIKNPVNYYQYYSNVYKSLGDYEEALDYQEDAIEELEDLGEENIPQYMLENLAYLESKVD
ncbi:TonB family protein [Kangiella shandongensis]|uniref:TonB family protein n=1 Tax=Kangiella shandongensis TaxID=2763258 RepID=UPI001CBBBAAC|nr:TonB family protein [Kangiella shandongensis]